jgi:hypothetical protein
VEPVAVAADAPKEKPEDPKPTENYIPVSITGAITDVDGKPITGARVSVSGMGEAEPPGPHSSLYVDGWTVTAADGTYKIEFKVRQNKSGKRHGPAEKVLATQILVEADGFVAYSENFQYFERVVSPEVPGKWDFVLVRGDVISGHVDVPDLKEETPLLVRGPSFTRVYFVGKDGKFRFWVPKGVYTLTAVVETDTVARISMNWIYPDLTFNRPKKVVVRAATAEKVASGTENLVLKLKKP